MSETTTQLATDNSTLDLAFAMDCTGSMGSYIEDARRNIRQIVEEIVSSEGCDVNLALVEYRDHPPQDSSFVTRVNDFTGSVSKMKKWLENCSASGGGDEPEAVADALHDLIKLNWRPNSTKICVFTPDAPPHGLSQSGDGFPNGCPAGLDPMKTVRQLAEKGVTLYIVGCEPSISPYKQFFVALAYLTGGQYVPLSRANLLSQVIVAGTREEISLAGLMAEVHQDVKQEVSRSGTVDEDELAKKLHQKLMMKNSQTRHCSLNNAPLAEASADAKHLADLCDMEAVRKVFSPVSAGRASFCPSSPRGIPASPYGADLLMAPPPPPGGGFILKSGVAGTAPVVAAPTSVVDSCSSVRGNISYSQVQRMVKKSVTQQNFK